jgi:hypothetical protein
MTYKGFSVLFDDENNIIKFLSNVTKDIIKIDYDSDEYTNILLYVIIALVLIVIISIIFNGLFYKKKKVKYEKISTVPKNENNIIEENKLN